MKKLEYIINNKFQEYLKGKNPKNHLYFESFEWWKGILKGLNTKYKIKNQLKEDISTSIVIKKINQTTFIPKKIASDKLLEKIYSVIKNKNTHYFYEITHELNKLENYNLPSTIKNIDKINLKDSTNILIIGGGPIGLFTSIYLNKVYKNAVNILLIDNRIKEEGIRLPYSRVSHLSIDLEELKLFFSNIVCLEFYHNISNNPHHFTCINILENLLYIYIYHHKIPIYFTKKLDSFQEVKKYAIEKNFNYIFDCTGGRLNPNFTINKEIKWNQYKFKKNNYEVKYVGNNLYKFFINNKEYKHTTVVLHLYDKNKKEYIIGNLFADINNKSDENLIEKYKNILMRKEDYINLASHIQDFNLRNLFYYILQERKALGITLHPKYIKITSFITCSNHVKQVAKILNKKMIYIGLGDTLGNSEYGIFFGLNTGIQFSKFICNLIQIVKYLKN